MLFTCPEGCQEDIGMTRAREGQHRCDKHGLVLTYGKALGRSQPAKKRKRGSSLKRGRGFAASPAQQRKVKGLPCVRCGREAGEWVSIDPAHLWPRGKGGCGEPACVVPLCRDGMGNGCHEEFDGPKGLDILPPLIDKGYWPEIAHVIEAHQVSPTQLLERLTGTRWQPIERVAA